MKIEELLKRVTDSLENMTDDHGYSSYTSDDEKESESHIMEARALIKEAREFISTTA